MMDQKIYKVMITISYNMIPSDPTGLLDDFLFSWRLVWKK